MQDRAVIERTAYGSERPLGSRPALILVDFQPAYLGDDVAILDQLVEHPAAGGKGAWDALRASLPVLATARQSGIPVVLSRIAYPAGQESENSFARKRGAAADFIDGSIGSQFAEQLEPTVEDILIRKEAASCFHETDLIDVLRQLNIDTVLIAGLSTSGCVRATAVDAAGFGLSVAVISDGCADRIQLSHRVALFDIWMKYGEVLGSLDAIDYITRLSGPRAGQPQVV